MESLTALKKHCMSETALSFFGYLLSSSHGSNDDEQQGGGSAWAGISSRFPVWGVCLFCFLCFDQLFDTTCFSQGHRERSNALRTRVLLLLFISLSIVHAVHATQFSVSTHCNEQKYKGHSVFTQGPFSFTHFITNGV